jgi:hypothetical protein
MLGRMAINGGDPTYQTCNIPMLWIQHWEEYILQKQKTSSWDLGGNQYEQQAGGSWEGGIPRGHIQQNGQRKVLTCFNSGKPGQFKQDCQQKLQSPPYYQQGQGLSHTRQADVGSDNVYVACQIVDNQTTQQKAQDWLMGVAGESNDVKDLVMQQLWNREDFQDA